MKIKENEKRDKYSELARELRKLWNMKVSGTPIVITAFGTFSKGLLRDREELENGGQSSEIPSAKAVVKNSQVMK